MGQNNPNTGSRRRAVLQALAATGVSASILPQFTTANRSPSENNEETSDDTEMDDLDYQVDYDIDRFDGQNVSCSGSVRYESKKYAADDSFYTWQSGTWVNACDDSRKTNIISRNIYSPDTNDSRVILEVSGSTESNLVFSDAYAYTDDENSEEFPTVAWSDYAFDVAWSIVDEATPFYVPPRPPSVSENGDETDIDPDYDGATIKFYDPTPTTSDEEFTVTHSADWKWDISGGVNPGWNYVHADRKVDVGESVWDAVSNWTFGKEVTHQMALSTAFCIYTEDETICESDGCPNCRTNLGDLTTELRECCQLEAVQNPIPVSADHIDDARTSAQENVTTNQLASRFEEQAATELSTATEAERPLRTLIAYRSAAAHARGATALRQSLNGERTADQSLQQNQQLRAQIQNVHERVPYTGKTLDEAIGVAGQVEKRLVSARSWTENAEEAFELDYLDEGEQIKYAESGAEFAAGNLGDAEFYLDSSADLGQSVPDRGDELEVVGDKLHRTIRADLEMIDSGADSHVAYALRNAGSYLDRATDRRKNGFRAAGLLDAVYAYGYCEAARQLAAASFETVDRSTLEVEQELTADRYNKRATAVSGEVERFLLKLAGHEYNTGVESFGTFVAMDDREEAVRAFRHYTVTEAFLDCTDLIYDELESV